GRPSRSTVHAPQWVVSHPMWVPVRRSTSRSRWTRRSRGSTSACCFSPLIVSWTSTGVTSMCTPLGALARAPGAPTASLPRARALHRAAQRRSGQPPHEVPLVLHRATQVGAGLGGRRGQFGGAADGRLVGAVPHEGRLGPLRLDRRRPDVGEPDAHPRAGAVRPEGDLGGGRRGGEVAHLALHLHVGPPPPRRG